MNNKSVQQSIYLRSDHLGQFAWTARSGTWLDALFILPNTEGEWQIRY